MKLMLIFVLTTPIFIAACGKREEVKGVIFERKELPNNRLLIHFRYLVDNTIFVDSATVANKVLPGDSIHVFIDPANPGKGLPDLSGRQ